MKEGIGLERAVDDESKVCEQGCLIWVANRQRKFLVERERTKDIAAFVFESLGMKGAELSIVFVSDRRMTQLNRCFLSRNRSTDVLAFSQLEGQGGGIRPEILGDVVISTETAAKQAMEEGVSLGEELNALLVHGILHLLGYEHTLGRDEARLMKNKERELLRAIRKRFPEEKGRRNGSIGASGDSDKRC